MTREEPVPGLFVYQPARGYRYAMEPFLLAGWILEGGVPRSALDVGSGCGILALLLAGNGVRSVTGLDVHEKWIELARRSACESGLDARVRFEAADIRTMGPADRYDVACCNPPYRRAGSGPLPKDPLLAAARHEIHGTLDELIGGMAPQGDRICLVLPAERGDEAARSLARHERPVTRRCDVGPLTLVEGRPGYGDVICETERTVLRDGSGWGPRVRDWYAAVGARLSPPA